MQLDELAVAVSPIKNTPVYTANKTILVNVCERFCFSSIVARRNVEDLAVSHHRQPIISAVENVPCYYLSNLSTWIACKRNI